MINTYFGIIPYVTGAIMFILLIMSSFGLTIPVIIDRLDYYRNTTQEQRAIIDVDTYYDIKYLYFDIMPALRKVRAWKDIQYIKTLYRNKDYITIIQIYTDIYTEPTA